MKKVLVLFSSVAIMFASCSKKDAASVKELDGTWKVSSSSMNYATKSYSWVSSLSSAKLTYESSNTETVNGGVFKDVSSYSNYSYLSNGTFTTYKSSDQYTNSDANEWKGTKDVSITFAKKEGTVKIETTTKKKNSTTKVSDVTIYLTVAPWTKTVKKTVVTETTVTETQTQSGTFYVNQTAGELAKGSKLIIEITSDKTETDTETTQSTTQEKSDGTIPTVTEKSSDSDVSTVTSEGQAAGQNYTMIYDVTEAKGKSLIIDWTGTYTRNVESESTYGSTTTKSESKQEVTGTGSTTLELQK